MRPPLGPQCRDASRDRYLQDRGLLVLRFWNHEILDESDAVFDRILAVLRQRIEPELHISC